MLLFLLAPRIDAESPYGFALTSGVGSRSMPPTFPWVRYEEKVCHLKPITGSDITAPLLQNRSA